LKKLKENISFMDICRIPQQKDFMLQYLSSVGNPMTSTNQGGNITPTDLRNKPIMNSCSKDKKEKPFVPAFLLTFEIFNIKLHNYLANSGASSNVMPFPICKKLNAIPIKRDKHAIHLDKTQVKIMG
jgi:hypothetical protein